MLSSYWTVKVNPECSHFVIYEYLLMTKEPYCNSLLNMNSEDVKWFKNIFYFVPTLLPSCSQSVLTYFDSTNRLLHQHFQPFHLVCSHVPTVLQEQHRKSIALQQSDTSWMHRHKKSRPGGRLAVGKAVERWLSRSVPAVAVHCLGANGPDSRPRPATSHGAAPQTRYGCRRAR